MNLNSVSRQIKEAILHWLVEQRRKFKNTLKVLSTKSTEYLIVNGSFKQNGWEVIPTNFGDDLNVFLLNSLTGKNIINFHEYYHLACPRNYMVIGSVLNWKSNKNTVVWGSGAINEEKSEFIPPLKISAVRGEKTRQFLVEAGIDCPSVFGDPALLLPLIYNNDVPKKHRVGVIPHYIDLYSELVKTFVSKSDDVILIDIQRYQSVTELIDSIRSCEVVISSSLHGLVISDAYSIPNLWVKFSDNIIGDEFKFRDYFSAVKRQSDPLIVTDETSLSDILPYAEEYRNIQYESSTFLKACPFELIIDTNV